MQGAIAFAIERVGIRPFIIGRKRDPRCFIELGILFEEFTYLAGP
jgi:hypothetical protein